MGIKRALKKTPLGHALRGDFRGALDPFHLYGKSNKKRDAAAAEKKKDKMKKPIGMKKGGQVCRGMGAAKRGGNFKVT